MGLYPTSLKDKGERVEIHANVNAFVMTNVEVNNAFVKKNHISFVIENP